MIKGNRSDFPEVLPKYVRTDACSKNVETVFNRGVLIRIQHGGASLVAQWLGICLPMQGTRVRALVWEDPTCRGATRPVSHNY